MQPTFLPSAPAIAVLSAMARSRGVTLEELAAALGLRRRSFYRQLSREFWRWDLADRFAVALGRHPCEVWPDWFGNGAEY